MYRPLFNQIAAFSQRYTTVALDMPEPLLQLLFSEIRTLGRVSNLKVFSRLDGSSNFLTISHTGHRWESLAVLHLECVTVAQSVKFIQSAPVLKSCTISRMIWEDDMPTPTLQHVTHKHLSILIVCALKNDTFPTHSLFAYLTLPQLAFLEYSVLNEDQNLPQWQQVERLRDGRFLEFIKRTGGRLKYLVIRGVSWNYEFFTSVFREAPSIRNLGVHSRCRIGNESVSSTLRGELAHTASQRKEELTAPLLLPSLQILILYSKPRSSPKISWDLVSKCFGPASEFQQTQGTYRRLKDLTVYCNGNRDERTKHFIDKDSLLQLIELRKAGAQIAYWFTGWGSNSSSNFFAASRKFHGLDESGRGN
ncbi:hypothetical protein CPC08DRAFT_703968 [Agrocybe pediades]|nr:hypothetical protein CPC08DRAFT_703968 [Agrocybe pediades]